MMMTSSFTCVNCGVSFKDSNIQRQHYKTDWHRYNLKRMVAELPAVTAEEFTQKVMKQRFLDAENLADKSVYCIACKKKFSTVKAYENHIKSKKHQEKISQNDTNTSENNVTKCKQKIDSIPKKLKTEKADISDDSCLETDSEVEELSSDEWNEDDDNNPINKNNCLFCNHHSKSLVANIKHMSEIHSFFLPDLEYCTDLKGLLLHLGAKVFYGHICLWCNGKSFGSVKAVQKHMIDKGHTNILHEGETLIEFSPFYDYSSSYPDHEVANSDEEVEVTVLEGTDYQLVLPSGSVIGHRSLLRYYKQNLNPKSGMLMQHKVNQILNKYKTYGYTLVQKEIAQRKARDIKFMNRIRQKIFTQRGCKSNILQKHFRPQVNF